MRWGVREEGGGRVVLVVVVVVGGGCGSGVGEKWDGGAEDSGMKGGRDSTIDQEGLMGYSSLKGCTKFAHVHD